MATILPAMREGKESYRPTGVSWFAPEGGNEIMGLIVSCGCLQALWRLQEAKSCLQGIIKKMIHSVSGFDQASVGSKRGTPVVDIPQTIREKTIIRVMD